MTPATLDAPTAANPFVAFQQRYEWDPVGFVREVLGVEPDPWQREFLETIAERRGQQVTRISIRSGHRVGKTCALAFVFWWWHCTRFPQKSMISAASAPQLFDALVPEIKTWYLRLPKTWQDVFEVQAEGVRHRASPDESFASFRTSKAEAPESAAGIHAEHVLYLNDEASGIPDAVFEAQIGSFADPHVLYILAGNPVRRNGFFYETHQHLGGWDLFKVSALDTPRVGQALIDEAYERYGEDSNAFRVRVLGEFPLADEDAIIPFELTEPALTRYVLPTMTQPIWGVDPAGLGRDRSAVAKRKGNVLMEPVKAYLGLNTMQLAGRIYREYLDTRKDEQPSEICVDSIGIGMGVADRLRELGLNARSINVSESPAMGDRFVSLKPELWWKAREWFETKGVALGGRKDDTAWADPELARELNQQCFDTTSNGRIKLTGDKRIKGKSPDLADAFILTFAAEAVSASAGSAQGPSWRARLKRNIKGLV